MIKAAMGDVEYRQAWCEVVEFGTKIVANSANKGLSILDFGVWILDCGFKNIKKTKEKPI